jgi:NADH:ubiquinone oxidoreductase subunit 4 (subunit M)
MSPAIGLLWFLVIGMNLAAPPTFNLLAELTIVVSFLSQLKYLGVIVVGIVLTSSVYRLVLFSRITQRASAKSNFATPVSGAELLNARVYVIPGWLMILASSIYV